MSYESSHFIDQALRFHKSSSDLARINRKAGLKWTCLDFRHTFDSMLAMKGESLYKISTLMGNSPEICRRHYAAFIPENMADSLKFDLHQNKHSVLYFRMHVVYISKIEIENFRCFSNTKIEFNQGVNVIIGENNAGKSSLLDALRLVFGGVSRTNLQIYDFHRGKETIDVDG